MLVMYDHTNLSLSSINNNLHRCMAVNDTQTVDKQRALMYSTL